MSANRRKLTVILGFIVLLPLIFLVGRWTGGPSVHEEHRDAATAAPEEETLWTCSMHPQVQQPDPGQCPICGMDLIPMTTDGESADESDLPRLRVSERSAALMNIQTWPVERREVEREVRLLGRVNFDETRRRMVTAWMSGRLDSLLVGIEGSRIQRGDAVAEIYSPALISAQEELLQALRTSRGQGGEESAMVAAARERLELLGLGADQIGAVEERGTVEDHIVIHSPVDGVITERVAVEGTYVEAGDRIAALAALDRVFIDLEAYERDLPWLAEGQTVRFDIDGLGGATFSGTIDQINPYVDRERRIARVRALVDNSEGLLKPGMFARATVVARLGGAEGLPEWREELPLVIPATAALITGRRAVVYVKVQDTGQPTFELRQVTLGPRAGEQYVVRDGLEEGELVVSHGSFRIDSELQLRGRPSMMAPEGGGAGDHDHASVDLRDSPDREQFEDPIAPGFANEIAPVVDAYLEVSQSLADDDSEAAQKHLGHLREHLKEIGRDRLSGEASVSWEEDYKALEEILQEMSDGSGLEGVRSHLQKLTHQVESIYVKFGRGTLPAVYRVYCPMARDDRGGTWLQKEQEISNPYFGSSMVGCGEIVSEVPAR